MLRLVPASGFLYTEELHDFRELMKDYLSELEIGMLKTDISTKPVIIDFPARIEEPHYYMVLGFGYHFSDFGKRDAKPAGVSFSLNPPYLANPNELEDVLSCGGLMGNSSTFTFRGKQFLLTHQKYNLDKIILRELETGEIYKRR